MSSNYTCPICNHQYQDVAPNFCVKCGTKLMKPAEVIVEDTTESESTEGLADKKAESEKASPSLEHEIVIKQPVIKSSDPISSETRLTEREITKRGQKYRPPRKFRIIKNDYYLLLLGIVIFVSSFESFVFIGWISIIVILILTSNSESKFQYNAGGKSSSAKITLIIVLLSTLPLIDVYFFELLVVVISYSIVHYYTPPKEVVSNYLNRSLSELPLYLGGILFVYFLYLGSATIAVMLLIGFSMYQIYNLHSNLRIAYTSNKSATSIPASTPVIPAYVSPIAGIVPNIDVKGIVPMVSDHLTQATLGLQSQIEHFNLNLKNLDTQYKDLANIVNREFLPEIDAHHKNQSIDTITSRRVNILIQNMNTLRSQLMQFESERKSLFDVHLTNYDSYVMETLEELLRIAKSNKDAIGLAISETEVFTIENEMTQLQKIDGMLSELKQTIIEREESVRLQEIERRQESEQLRSERIEVKSFKLQALISEKVVSNLFAYIGVAFVIAGFLFLLNFTYDNYILVNFPETAPFNDARFGVGVLYLFSIIVITVPSWVLNKIGVNFKIITPIFVSVGLIFLQLTLYVQAFYFENLDLENESFAMIGTVIIVIAYFVAYLQKSQLVGLTATEFGIWLFYLSAINSLTNQYIVSIGFGMILAISFWLLYQRKLWVPIASFSLFTPVLLTSIYQNNNNIWLPEYLTLAISTLNILIVIKKKMPTPRPFSNFVATTSLIYPNFIALQLTVLLPSARQIQTFQGTSSIIIVLTSFFVLYWIYVLFEEDIILDFSMPVSYKFKEGQLTYQKIEQKLNWLMLSSLLILFIAGLSLADKQIYLPLAFFAAFMALMSNIALIKNFEKFVKNSSVLFIAESQVFYILNLFNPEAPGIWIALLTGIFLLSFTFNFSIISKYQANFNLQGIKISPVIIGFVVAITSVINYLLGSFSKFESIVLFVAVTQWIVILHSYLILDSKTSDHRIFMHIASVSAPLTLFLGGLFKQTTKFDQSSTLNHIMINSPLILIILYLIYLAYNGSRLTLTEGGGNTNFTSQKWYDSFIHPNKIYAPQLLLFLLPNVFIIYGKPYFFFPERNQALLMIYLIAYFILLPSLFVISERQKNKSFSILSSLWGYFSFLLAFVILGGAKQVYDKIINAPPTTSNPKLLIPLEWAIFMFVVIFVVSISWTLSLSKRFDTAKLNSHDQLPFDTESQKNLTKTEMQ